MKIIDNDYCLRVQAHITKNRKGSRKGAHNLEFSALNKYSEPSR